MKEPTYLEKQDDLRYTIETAIAVFNFLEEIDLKGGFVLANKLTNDLHETKLKALKLICESTNALNVSV